MKKESNQLIQFFAGLVMLVAGVYWFMSSVTVTTGFGGFRLGGVNVSAGLVVVPFIVGIVMLFFNFDSILSKLVTGLGFVIIIASIIMNTSFYFRQRSLYEYLLMLVFIFGGAAMILKALFVHKDKK